METRLLSEKQYLQTMNGRMINVTEDAETVVNFWCYGERLMSDGVLSEYAFQRRYIEAVYINHANTYQHILLFANKKNCYIVIVVDVIQKTILGHYVLDLNELYSVNE